MVRRRVQPADSMRIWSCLKHRFFGFSSHEGRLLNAAAGCQLYMP
jgi:hypothetical protein